MGVDRPQPMRLEMEVEESVVLGRLNRHIVPWLFTLAMICYLDRTNLSFGALELNMDLRFSCMTYGFGAGIFFVGYALFQLPLTLAPQRFGAPVWLFAVCALWSCVTMAQAAVRGPISFYVLRFLLGVSESSAFPTMYYLLSLFYSPAEMSMAYSRVATGNSVAHVVGGPLAAGLLHLDGVAGLRGWQWLFIAGGMLTLLFASVMRVFLAGEPRTAWFLTPTERDWLHTRQATSSQAEPKSSKFRAILEVARDWRVLYLAVVWMMAASAVFGIMFWAPLLIASMFGDSATATMEVDGVASDGGKICSQGSGHGLGTSTVALLTTLPHLAGAICILINARHAERTNERRLHAAVPLMSGGFFLAFTTVVADRLGPTAGFVCLVTAAGCTWAFHGPFFTWPSVFLKGGACASAFALINSFGSLGGFIGPSLIGVVSNATGSYAAAMAALGGLLALSGVAVLGFPVTGTNDVRMDIMDSEEIMALNIGGRADGEGGGGGMSPREADQPAEMQGSGRLRSDSLQGSAGLDAEAGLGHAPTVIASRTRSASFARRP